MTKRQEIPKTPGYKRKQRNSFRRQEKKLLIVSSEGKNKTEQTYFSNFNSDGIQVHFADGGATDPAGITKALLKKCDSLGFGDGDLAVSVFDTDVNPVKNSQIEAADRIAAKQPDNFMTIVSNPCFEIWFLCHFTASTKQYASSNELVKLLGAKYIKGYEKNMNVGKELMDKLPEAMKNAKMLEKHCLENGFKPHTVSFCPSTEVYKVIDWIQRNE